MGESILRQIHGERVLLAGGQRSLVMQLAHPLVAAAVSDHSDFPARALERLNRTIDLTLALVHGSPREAGQAAARIRSVHRRVTGVAEAGGRREAYRAEDPKLLLWVHATVVDTTMLVYRHFVGPLSARQREVYYEAMKEPARLLGVPDRVIPPDLASFRTYMHDMVTGPDLHATDAGRSLVGSVLRPPVGRALRPVTEAARLVTLAPARANPGAVRVEGRRLRTPVARGDVPGDARNTALSAGFDSNVPSGQSQAVPPRGSG